MAKLNNAGNRVAGVDIFNVGETCGTSDRFFTTGKMNGFLHFENEQFVGLAALGKVERNYQFWENFITDLIRMGFYESIDIEGIYAISEFTELDKFHNNNEKPSLGAGKPDGLFVTKSVEMTATPPLNMCTPNSVEVPDGEIFEPKNVNSASDDSVDFSDMKNLWPALYAVEDLPVAVPNRTLALLAVDRTFSGEIFATLIPVKVKYFPRGTNFSPQQNIMIQLDGGSGEPKKPQELDWKLFVHYNALKVELSS